MTLVGWLAATAAGQPDRPALHQDGDTWSWGRLWERSARIAGALTARDGFRRGRTVGLIGANEPDYVAAYVGILRAGGVVVPLNPMLSAAELVRAAEFADLAGTVVGDVDAERREALATAASAWPLDRLEADRLVALPDPDPEAPACILLTSGSTGRPKGVVHTQATMLHAALQIAMTFPYAPDERSVAFLPFFACIPEQVLPTLLAGGSVDCIRRFDEERISGRARTGRPASMPCRRSWRGCSTPRARGGCALCAGSCSHPSRCPCRCSNAGGTRCRPSRPTSSTA